MSLYDISNYSNNGSILYEINIEEALPRSFKNELTAWLNTHIGRYNWEPLFISGYLDSIGLYDEESLVVFRLRWGPEELLYAVRRR